MGIENLELWDSVKDTDPQYTRPESEQGFDYTAIKPMYHIHKATELWGPLGSSWGVKSVSFNNFPVGETLSEYELNGKKITDKITLLMCNYTAIFYYPGGEFPITAAIQITFSGGNADRFYSKSVATDALTKGLSMLGFSADIYLSAYDESGGGLQSYKNSPAVNPFENEEVNLIEDDSPVIVKKSDLDIAFKAALDKKDYPEDKKMQLIESVSDFVKQSFIDGAIREL